MSKKSARAEAPPESITVKLRRALGTRGELVLRRPTAAEIRPLPMRALRAGSDGRTSGATWGDMFSIVAGCADVELEELKKLCAPDAVAVVGAVNRFVESMDSKAAHKARVKKNANGSVTFTLARPLQVGSEKIAVLELKAPQGSEIWEMSIEPTPGELLDFACRCSLQSAAILDRLDFEDALLLVEVMSDFFEHSRPTGEAS